MMPQFTTNWFDRVVPEWQKHLLNLNAKSMIYLEIGIFEGKSACWMLDNVLLHPESQYIGIDIWTLKKRRYPDPRIIENRARQNLSRYGDKVQIIRRRSQEALLDEDFGLWDIDIAYIDGDHSVPGVLVDSCLVWPRVKSGGIIIWDDYKMRKSGDVKAAVDYFLGTVEGRYQILWKGWQAAIRKVRNCYSKPDNSELASPATTSGVDGRR